MQVPGGGQTDPMNSDILMQGNARDEMQRGDRTRDDGSEAGYRKSKKWKI